MSGKWGWIKGVGGQWGLGDIDWESILHIFPSIKVLCWHVEHKHESGLV